MVRIHQRSGSRSATVVLWYLINTVTICRRLSSELETVGTAARDFEERLRFQLETSLRTEEEQEARVRQMTANLSTLGRGNTCAANV
jgi:hypothetical protein